MKKSKSVRRESSIFLRFIKVPIRVLARARDLYIQSLTGSGSHVSYGNAMGCPTPQISSLPRSSSSNSQSGFKSAEEELRDLIRLASTRKTGTELRRSKSSVPLGGGGGAAEVMPVPRCNTAPFGRIDEDKPLIDFGEDEEDGLLGGVHPRSRVHAVSRGIKVA